MCAVYYRDASEVEPVREFLRRLPPDVRASVDVQIERLNLQRVNGPPLPFPHSSQVEGEMRELRCHHGTTLYRVLYRRSHNLLILLHIFVKASKRIPEEEIEIARRRWTDFQTAMNPVPQPPRRIGHDAP